MLIDIVLNLFLVVNSLYFLPFIPDTRGRRGIPAARSDPSPSAEGEGERSERREICLIFISAGGGFAPAR
jgi:hypothetical protein